MSSGFGFRPENSDDQNSDQSGSNNENNNENGDAGSEPKESSHSFEGSFEGNFDINKVFEQMRAMGLPTPELPDHLKDQLNSLTAMAQGIFSQAKDPSGAPFTLPINVIRDISRRALAERGELPVGHLDDDAMKGALQLADLWIDTVTSLPKSDSAENASTAASRSDWINYSIDGWQSFTTPLVEGIADAMQRILPGSEDAQGAIPGLNAAMPMINISQLMAGFMGTMIRTQLGRSIGKFATTVTSAHDAAIPLSPSTTAFLIPENVRAWGEGLGIDPREIEIYLALREAAAARLFTATPWLREHLHSLVSRYGKGINIDVESMQRQAEDALSRGEIDPNDPISMQNAIAQGIFTPEESEAQRIALAQLELILALIEGWIDLVVTEAAGYRLASLSQLQETQRRRRATQSPTQELFASLIGLEVSPRTIRECAHFWREVTSALSIEERDQLWEDPFALPTVEEIADPEKFLRTRRAPDDLSGLEG
ncbi:MAG: zinc-dependent metalloprotease [Candidatus Nanopelagicaceae bacterium]